MIGSIYVGLSGLKSYSEGLDQVSNNVTNLNSLGFKTSTISFSNLQTTRDSGGVGLQGGSGGSGGGVTLAQSQTDFRPGELLQTGRDLDLAVDGTGFLVLLKGDEVRYARTGSFDLDEDGYIVLRGTEWRLATLDGAGRAVALSIDDSSTDTPVATTRIAFADNLSSTATSYGISDVNVYDESGTRHVWQIAFSREENATEWTVTVIDDEGRSIGEKTLAFAGFGPTPETEKLVFEDAENGLSVEFDFSANVTSFSSGSVSTLRAASVDGKGAGTISTIAVNAEGQLELGYSNDETKSLGPVALATFRDPQTLLQESSGLFAAGASAQVQLHASEDSRAGKVLSRRLEASNVDLSGEFGQLILIQRGYQASSQIISVANDMIQQLFGIRGQG